VERHAAGALPPADRLEAALHGWVAFAVMPLFALANAGVPVRGEMLGSPVAWAVVLGLVVGKPVGIVLFSWLAVRSGAARMPAGVTMPVLAGAGMLGGIGFTMSMFIANLALEADLVAAGKAGTLLGSLASAVAGGVVLACCLRGRAKPAEEGA